MEIKTMKVPKTALEWIVANDTGLSSITIWASMLGVKTHWASIPRDITDFGRCYRLLESIPTWRERLDEVAEAHPEWLPMVRDWESLENLYRCDNCNEFMTLIRSLVDEGREAKHITSS